VAINGNCPSCGTALEQMLYMPLICRDTLTITGDLACGKCEYNLRTMSISSRCPECGLPIAESIVSDDLRFEPLDRLKGLRNSLVGIILACLSVWTLVCAVVIFPLLMVVCVFGLLDEKSKAWPGQKDGRLLEICGLAIGIGLAAAVITLGGGYITLIAAPISLVCFTIVGWCVGVPLKEIARRARRPRLEKAVGIAVVALFACCVAGLVLVAVMLNMFTAGSAMTASSGVTGLHPEWVALGVFVVAYVVWLYVLVECYRVVRRAIRQSATV
jgi:hypothetical protein